MEGHDEQSLLYNFLDELLFVFGTEMLVCREITMVKLDRVLWRIQAIGWDATPMSHTYVQLLVSKGHMSRVL